MSDLDIVLALAFSLHAECTRTYIRRLIKRAPQRRRATLGLFLKSKKPRKMVENFLSEWD